ncbi:UDP-N-acetylglucosamine 4,6-dehydratase [Moorella thermoacetica]|uniref:UDP-N-acetylglucosamine 4,6-dehydratase n=1 Tax=Neomoorella thermoacetica TaxID=1525 RepID=A0AAC9MUC1_NEOTH|nr:UDP-N-acetylglucosamine 4,6-dehydratase family protein [Moorella thermoacetica]AOQ23402.1 UDP-N-acetylglucosamine 4,6-dehydratase (inverting) [Moorella thermoacetica]TYL06937.1 UDP-N-acetylglucosamine 4,6-dehydratase [Moorella thermoacetica]
MRELLTGKKILITGGTGTIGQALVREILPYNPEVIRVYSRDEEKQFWLQQELSQYGNVRFFLGDVRDRERLRRAMAGVDIVFHAAALKHVPACEYNPFEAVKTNVLGTENVIEAAMAENVERVICTSSDKAINPANTMGATKLLAERLIISASFSKGRARTIFAAVRFGNVIGSRGSVIPLFHRQIARGGPVTVTDPEMTRFMMSRQEAVKLALQACHLAQGGEVFVLKMPVVKLGDLVDVLITYLAPVYGYQPRQIGIERMGLRPGEKRFEELMTEDEAAMAWELPDMFIIPGPYTAGHYPEARPAKGRKNYRSTDYSPLTKDQIINLLQQEGLLATHLEFPGGLCDENPSYRRSRFYRAVGG